MKKTLLVIMALVMVCSFAFVACQSTTNENKTGSPESQEASKSASETPSETTSESAPESASESASTGEALEGDAAAIAKEFDITPLELLDDPAIFPLKESIGPNGEKGVGVAELLKLFKSGDKEKIQGMGLTAAILMHTTASDFAKSQLEGMTNVFKEFGIEIVTQTDAEFDAAKSIDHFEAAIGMKPDIIIHFVVDGAASLPLIQQATKEGIVVSLIDSIPEGLGEDEYAGTTMADNFSNGYYTMKNLCEKIGGKGQVAMINYIQDLFHTNQRTFGALEALKEFPDIELVEQQSHDGTTENCAEIADAFIVKYPDLRGIWTVWDMPGMAAVGAVENAGKADQIKVASIDMAEDIAENICSDGACVGLTAQHPYDQGVAEALVGIAAALDLNPPKYIMVPGELVTKTDVETFSAIWERIYHSPMPDRFKELLSK